MTTKTGDQSRAVQAISNYIQQSKGWDTNDYRVEFNRRENDALVYWVIHGDDENATAPGSGKSVEVYLDAKTLEVLRELHFQ